MDIRRNAAWFAVAAICGGLFGCGPEPIEPDQPDDAERCVADASGDMALEARVIAVGAGDAASFRAFQDGEEAEIVGGFQGGYMITPTVRVEAAGDSREEACFRVHLSNVLMEGGEIGPGTLAQVVFTRSGDFFYVEGLFNLLGYDPDSLRGKTLLLSTTVSGAGFEGKQDVTLLLK